MPCALAQRSHKGALRGCGLARRVSLGRFVAPPYNAETPDLRGLPSAAEWSRTITSR